MTETTSNPLETGLYVTLACICERALQEADGTVSIIRVTDEFVVEGTETDTPQVMPSFVAEFTMVLAIKSEANMGEVDIKMIPENPSGQKGKANAFVADFTNTRSYTYVIQSRQLFEEPGFYWYGVYLNDALATKIPFEVTYRHQSSIED